MATNDKLTARVDLLRRQRVLDKGLIACYEIIDRIRREMAEIAAKKAQSK